MSRPASISIVTPSFNQAAFLARTLESVRLQDAACRMEHLVKDGGSTDGSVELLRQAAASWPALRWTSGPDEGQADAVNAGWREATGELLGWLNSDDCYRPGTLARVLDCFARQPDLQLVYGEGIWIDETGTSLGRYPTLPPPQPLAAFADGCFLCQPTVFFRRQLLDTIGFLDTGLDCSMDMEFWMRAFAALPARAIGFVPEVQAESRLHAAAKTLRQRTTVMLESMAVLARHLGQAPAHWVLSWVEEILGDHPQRAVPLLDPARWQELWDCLAPLLGPAGAREVQDRLAANRRLALLTPDLGLDMQPDGWSGPVLTLRIRRRAPRERCELTLDLPRELPAPVCYELSHNGCVLERGRREAPGSFVRGILLGNPDHLPQGMDVVTLTITSQPPHPTDSRTLGFAVQAVTVTPCAK